MNQVDQKTIQQFLHSQPLATLSTIGGGGTPESALVAFLELENFEIIFETFYDARKYANIGKNPAVALVTGWDPHTHITFQYEGKASEIPEKETEAYIRLFLQKDTPCTETFLRNPKVRLFKITPTWLRYSDYTGEAPRIVEYTF
jgi:general stress protein 26